MLPTKPGIMLSTKPHRQGQGQGQGQGRRPLMRSTASAISAPASTPSVTSAATPLLPPPAASAEPAETRLATPPIEFTSAPTLKLPAFNSKSLLMTTTFTPSALGAPEDSHRAACGVQDHHTPHSKAAKQHSCYVRALDSKSSATRRKQHKQHKNHHSCTVVICCKTLSESGLNRGAWAAFSTSAATEPCNGHGTGREGKQHPR